MVVRQYEEELKYIERIDANSWRIKKGFQPNMNVEGVFYVNKNLEALMFEELKNACRPGQTGGFLPGVKQIANVAALPGIVGRCVLFFISHPHLISCLLCVLGQLDCQTFTLVMDLQSVIWLLLTWAIRIRLSHRVGSDSILIVAFVCSERI